MPRAKKLRVETTEVEPEPVTLASDPHAARITAKMENLASMLADLQAEWDRFKNHDLSSRQPRLPGGKFPGEPKPAQTPVQLFIDRKLKDREVTDEAKKKYRQKFYELPEEKQVKWIAKAIEDEERYKTECAEFRLQRYDFKPRKKASITPKERILYDQYFKGRPAPPPRSAYILFCQDLKRDHTLPVDPRDKMRFNSQQWGTLKAKDLQLQEERLNQSIKDYIDQMKEYLDNQTKEERQRIKMEEPKTMPEYFQRLLARRNKKAENGGQPAQPGAGELNGK